MRDKRKKSELIVFSDGTLGFDQPFQQVDTIAQEQISANCGHVKRQMRRYGRLSGKTLEFALTVVPRDSEIAGKLTAGVALTEYETHLLFDVWLLHARLGSARNA